MLKTIVTALLLFSLPTQSLAWGREGHHIIALIAESRLSENAKTQIAALLGTQTLAEASTWPDEIRKDHPETAGWHYVDIPLAASFFDEHDCFQPDAAHPAAAANTDHHNCAVDRIDMFARIVRDPSQPKAERADALKYLIHFVSDLHQPMHALAEGRGGNDNHIVQFGNSNCGTDHPCNLHGLWDSGLIEHAEPNEQAYAHRIELLIARDRLDLVPEGTPRDWANESHLAAAGAYLPNGGVADQVYFDHEISVVDRRLALAGLRLANMLNSIFAQH